MSSILLRKNSSPLGAPATNKVDFYVGNDGRLHAIDENGLDVVFAINAPSQNFIRNSGFWFAQNQAPATPTATGTTGGDRGTPAGRPDGWGASLSTAGATYARVDLSGSPEVGMYGRYYGKWLKTTGDGKIIINQNLEGTDIQAARGRTVRFQCSIKAVGVNATFRLGVIQNRSGGDSFPLGFYSAYGGSTVDPSIDASFAYLAPRADLPPIRGTIRGNAVDCDAVTSAWRTYDVAVDVPYDCWSVLVNVWSDSDVVSGNGVQLAAASLTIGEESPVWTPLAYPLELRRVQRYFVKTFAIDTAPAQNIGGLGTLRSILGKAGATANAWLYHWRLPVPFRSATIIPTTYNPGAANANPRQITGTAADLSALSATGTTTETYEFTATGAGTGAVGETVELHVSLNAEI